MALRCQIIDFVRLNFLHQADEVGRVRHVTIVQEEGDVIFVRIAIEMINLVGIEG